MRLETLTHAQLRYNPAINARGETETDLSEVCATLIEKGFGQPLLVRPAGDGFYEPVDGSRRFHALGKAIAEGRLPPDTPVPALIRELTDAEALEMSLITAVTKLELNPADEAVSFQRLVKSGMDAAEIAAHFGVPIRRVKQRLAIAALPEPIVSALRKGAIGVDVAQAFTVGSDAKQMLKLFEGSHNANPYWIRSQLTQKRISAESREAKYVGLDAYRAAGGEVDEDLFSTNAWLTDGKLLNRLCAAKLKADEKRYLAEGWAFVEIETDPNAYKHASWPRLQPEGRPNLSKEQKARADHLNAEIKRLRQQLKKDLAAEDEDQLSAEHDAACDELDALTANHFTGAQKKKSGVAILYRHTEIETRFGLMKPAAAKKEAKAKASKQKARDTSRDPSAVRNITDEEADFTAALQAEMAKAMTEAMQAAIAANPGLALATMAPVLYRLAAEQSRQAEFCIEPARRDMQISSKMRERLEQARAALREFSSEELIMDLFSHSFAALFTCGLVIGEDRSLITAFDPDVGAHWQPGEEFFKRMPRESLSSALGEAAVPGVTPSKKKKELVEMALKHLTPCGWLPKPLRTPCYKGPGSNTWSEAHATRTADAIVAQQQAAPGSMG